MEPTLCVDDSQDTQLYWFQARPYFTNEKHIHMKKWFTLKTNKIDTIETFLNIDSFINQGKQNTLTGKLESVNFPVSVFVCLD